MALEAKQDRLCNYKVRSYQSKGVVISYGGTENEGRHCCCACSAPHWGNGAQVKGLNPTVLSPHCLHLCVGPHCVWIITEPLHTPASAFSVPIQQPKWSSHNIRQIVLFSVQTLQGVPVSIRRKAQALTTAFCSLDPSLQGCISPTQPRTTTTYTPNSTLFLHFLLYEI